MKLTMKLTDLNPKWFAEPGRHGQGIGFDCPHCKLAAASVDAPIERIQIPLSNPVDGGPAFPPSPGYAARWDRYGDCLPSFETLSIAPSINFVGHWHGYITGGEVRAA